MKCLCFISCYFVQVNEQKKRNFFMLWVYVWYCIKSFVVKSFIFLFLLRYIYTILSAVTIIYLITKCLFPFFLYIILLQYVTNLLFFVIGCHDKTRKCEQSKQIIKNLRKLLNVWLSDKHHQYFWNRSTTFVYIIVIMK